MLKYFATTTAILLWCASLSILWTWVAFEWERRSNRQWGSSLLQNFPILPTMVVAPVLLVLSYRLWEINLTFPVQALSSSSTIALASLAPAAVLFIGCGLSLSIPAAVQREYQYWSQMPFSHVALAYGRHKHSSVRRVVMVKAFLDSWNQCLPWLFGEMIIVEAVFNAPGVGLDAWHQARMREWNMMFTSIGGMAALYVACVIISSASSRWLGRRLEGYA